MVQVVQYLISFQRKHCTAECNQLFAPTMSTSYCWDSDKFLQDLFIIPAISGTMEPPKSVTKDVQMLDSSQEISLAGISPNMLTTLPLPNFHSNYWFVITELQYGLQMLNGCWTKVFLVLRSMFCQLRFVLFWCFEVLENYLAWQNLTEHQAKFLIFM